eukprot:136565-Rhodomonas_salina.1
MAIVSENFTMPGSEHESIISRVDMSGSDEALSTSEEEEGVSTSLGAPARSPNVAEQMMLNAGWRPGQSLGRTNPGIKEPLSASFRLDRWPCFHLLGCSRG